MVLTQPSGKIVALGEPLVDELNVETATNMYPGRLVKKGTNDNDIVVCGAGEKPVGWLGWEHAPGPDRPATLATAYGADDRAPVLYGGHFVIKAKLASGQNVSKGDWLVPAADGMVAAASALTVDSGGTSVTSTAANGAIISGDVGDNIIVGIAMESVNASSGAKDILVLSLI